MPYLIDSHAWHQRSLQFGRSVGPYLVHVDTRSIEPVGYGKAEVEYTLVTFEYQRDCVVFRPIGRRRAIVVLRVIMVAVAAHGFIV